MIRTQIHMHRPSSFPGAYILVEDPQAAQHTPEALRKNALGVITLREHGEAVKTLEQAACLYADLSHLGLKRNGSLVGVGGGTLGDLVGFVAATWLRGVRFSLIPTTLLAMVDSALGGKTGVNLPQGKNLVGAFHAPKHLFLDLQTLTTLPQRAFNAGMAEVLKIALLKEAAFFDFLESTQPLHAQHPDLLHVVETCIQTKQALVEQDPQEQACLEPRKTPLPAKQDRRALNLGHTVAHALEQATDYTRFLHGEAVSIGLCEALRGLAQDPLHPESHFLAPWAQAHPRKTLKRLEALLHCYELPTQLPQDLNKGAFIRATHQDKKVLHA